MKHRKIKAAICLAFEQMCWQWGLKESVGDMRNPKSLWGSLLGLGKGISLIEYVQFRPFPIGRTTHLGIDSSIWKSLHQSDTKFNPCCSNTGLEEVSLTSSANACTCNPNWVSWLRREEVNIMNRMGVSVQIRYTQ